MGTILRPISIVQNEDLRRKGVRGDGDADVVEHWSAGDRCGLPPVWGAWP